MLHEDTKAILCSHDHDTDFFDTVAEVLQGDTLALFLLIISLNYVLGMSIDLMKHNYFTKKKKTHTHIHIADDIPKKILLIQNIHMI